MSYLIGIVIAIVVGVLFWHLLEWLNKDLFYDMEFDRSFYIDEVKDD